MNGRNQRQRFRLATTLALVLAIPPSRSLSAEPLNFSLPNLDGTTFVFQDETKDGQLVLFDFWATWCGPCLKSLPAIEKIAAEYAERGLKVYTVNVDSPENHGKIPRFIEKHKLGLPVLLDSTLEMPRRLQLSGVPSTAVFKADSLLHREQGYGSGSDRALRRKLDKLLALFGPQAPDPGQ